MLKPLSSAFGVVRFCLGAKLRAVLVLAVFLATAVVIVGCRSEEQRYRVLSFFFDGVPLPASMLKDYPELANVGTTTAGGATQPAEKKPVVYYFHEPFANRSCFGCHDREAGFKAPSAGTVLCKRCHESYFNFEPGDWVHGPAMLGQCRFCHEHHKATEPKLLKIAQPGLCFQCHEQALLREDPLHGQLKADVTCTRCHDPHVVGNRKLLVDSRTYRNRGLAAFKPVSIHQPYKEKKCAECHIVEESNRIKEDINATCRSCHSALIETAPAGTHKAVTDGACVVCHYPHQSPAPHLVRVNAEQKCFACHKLEEIQTPKHPPVTRADCLICHAGHHSDQPHLLRSPQAIAQQAQPMPEDASGAAESRPAPTATPQLPSTPHAQPQQGAEPVPGGHS